MQFGVLVEVLLCELDGRVPGGMQLGVLVVEVLFCESDGWGARGHAVWGVGGGAVLRGLTAGCEGACSLGCWWRCCFARVMAGC